MASKKVAASVYMADSKQVTRPSTPVGTSVFIGGGMSTPAVSTSSVAQAAPSSTLKPAPPLIGNIVSAAKPGPTVESVFVGGGGTAPSAPFVSPPPSTGSVAVSHPKTGPTQGAASVFLGGPMTPQSSVRPTGGTAVASVFIGGAPSSSIGVTPPSAPQSFLGVQTAMIIPGEGQSFKSPGAPAIASKCIGTPQSSLDVHTAMMIPGEGQSLIKSPGAPAIASKSMGAKSLLGAKSLGKTTPADASKSLTGDPTVPSPN